MRHASARLDDHLTPAQAGRTLDVTAQRVRQLVAEGRLTCIRTGLGRLIDRGSVDRLKCEREARDPRRQAARFLHEGQGRASIVANDRPSITDPRETGTTT